MFGIFHARMFWYFVACVVVNAVVRAILDIPQKRIDAVSPDSQA